MSDEVLDLALYTFYPVATTAEVANGERIFFEIGNKAIVLFNIAGRYFAIGDVCTHDDGPLGDGDLDGYEVICPRHGARFDVRNGKAVKRPAVVSTPWYPVRVVGEGIEVGVLKV
jgi:nitrite reductase/ring-hydroxylating ferredoxin subunit